MATPFVHGSSAPDLDAFEAVGYPPLTILPGNPDPTPKATNRPSLTVLPSVNRSENFLKILKPSSKDQRPNVSEPPANQGPAHDESEARNGIICHNDPVNFADPTGLFQVGMFLRGAGGAIVSGVGVVVGAAAVTTGVGTLPGGALAVYSSYNFGANVGNMFNAAFRDVDAAPTGPIAGATVFATDSTIARNIAEAADLAIPLALSFGTSPSAWSRLPTKAAGPAGTLAGTLQRAPGDPAVIYPAVRGFQAGQAIVTAVDAWQWSWTDDPDNNTPNNSDPCLP